MWTWGGWIKAYKSQKQTFHLLMHRKKFVYVPTYHVNNFHTHIYA